MTEKYLKKIRLISMIGKIAAGIWAALGIAVVIYVMTHESNTENIGTLPRILLLTFVCVSCAVFAIAIFSAVTECVLIVKEYGKKGIKPVFFSFLMFYLLIAAYCFFTQASGKIYLYGLLASLAVTAGSCTLNLWRRKSNSEEKKDNSKKERL